MSERDPGSAPPEKREVRRRVLAERRALTPAERRRASRTIFERLVREPRLAGARCICAYAPLPYEVDISDLYDHVWAMGKALALPRIVDSTGELHLHRYERDDELLMSGFNVREPRPDAPLVADDEIDVVLVPGVAFDEQGYRVGYGKGYYDRLLPRLGAALRIGLGFDLQLVKDLPHDSWDVPLHQLITESRSLAFSGG